jgi:hypothetical protein
VQMHTLQTLDVLSKVVVLIERLVYVACASARVVVLIERLVSVACISARVIVLV